MNGPMNSDLPVDNFFSENDVKYMECDHTDKTR